MYKLIPDIYDNSAREDSRKALKEMHEFPDKLTADEKKYADFLESVIEVNQGYRQNDEKVSVEKFMEYHEKNLKKYHASTILEAV
jgi:predicted RND superfamily exporter protein